MMKHYEKPNMILIAYQAEDVLTTSANTLKLSQTDGFGGSRDISGYFN